MTPRGILSLRAFGFEHVATTGKRTSAHHTHSYTHRYSYTYSSNCKYIYLLKLPHCSPWNYRAPRFIDLDVRRCQVELGWRAEERNLSSDAPQGAPLDKHLGATEAQQTASRTFREPQETSWEPYETPQEPRELRAEIKQKQKTTVFEPRARHIPSGHPAAKVQHKENPGRGSATC